ncbi:hypothetical protein B9L23_06835 [Parageobacillus galactosidasius]|jgi:hypothetical protein|uniref:Uncharacterized protein n=1 Tax=Parageobacillus galactosidasius TaxID=883812 RepID=A0A226QRQ4_9BACL|nr:hypothetical protein B1689_14925 [Geobacillus sp. 44C]OXB94588.1 hypothetical protein B9L23_06835 [Parageobacillus galactosidasius]
MAEYFTYAQNLFVSPPHLPLSQSNLCKMIRYDLTLQLDFITSFNGYLEIRMTVNLEIKWENIIF